MTEAELRRRIGEFLAQQRRLKISPEKRRAIASHAAKVGAAKRTREQRIARAKAGAEARWRNHRFAKQEQQAKEVFERLGLPYPPPKPDQS